MVFLILVITQKLHKQLQVGFEMLFWGLAGFVNPEDYVADEKAGLSADALAGAAGVDEHDEFFKDNAIEVINKVAVPLR